MKHHHTHGRRYGRPGGWQQAQQPDASGAAEWFAGRLPETWFDGDPTVIVDREEITVVGKLVEPDAGSEESEARAEGRVSRFREETRSGADEHRRRSAGSLRAQGFLGRRGGLKTGTSEFCSRTSQYR